MTAIAKHCDKGVIVGVCHLGKLLVLFVIGSFALLAVLSTGPLTYLPFRRKDLSLFPQSYSFPCIFGMVTCHRIQLALA